MIPLIIGAVVGATMAIIGNSSADKAALELYKKKAKVIIHGYNYNQNALDTAEKSAYYSAMGELFNLQVNALQNNSAVEASLNETGYEGRSSKQISRVVSGQTYRQRTAVKSAYEQQVYEIRSKKDALYIQADNAMSNLQDETSDSMLGGFEKFMNVLNGAAIGAAAGAAGGALASGAAGSAGLTATGALGGTATNTLSASALSAGSTTVLNAGAASATSGLSTSATVLTAGSTASTGLTAGGFTLGGVQASALSTAGTSATTASALSSASQIGSTIAPTTTASAPTGFLQSFNAYYDQYSTFLKGMNAFNSFANYGSSMSKRGRYV